MNNAGRYTVAHTAHFVLVDHLLHRWNKDLVREISGAAVVCVVLWRMKKFDGDQKIFTWKVE